MTQSEELEPVERHPLPPSGTAPVAPASPVAPGAPDPEWRRLSSRMLLVHPVREVIRFIPALFGLVIVGSTGDGNQWWFGPAGVVVAVALGVLRWFTTRYRFTADQVQLRTGLLNRKSLTTPADRVRTVDVTASPLHRVLGLAKVEIGTGADDSSLTLDALPQHAADQLRAELLHRGRGAPDATPTIGRGAPDATPTIGIPAGSPGSLAVPSTSGMPPAPDASRPPREQELLRLDPGWVRYAPFAMTGLVAALATIGVGWRLVDRLLGNTREEGIAHWTAQQLESTAIWMIALLGALLLLVLVIVLSIGGYLLTYWGLRLTRHEGGTLHIARGLLTTRATSIEERRLRGVQLAEPLLLRSAGGARLSAITTGLKSGESGLLVPPAPAAVARGVAGLVVREPGVLEHPLLTHGPAARRRRYARAIGPVLVLTIGLVVGWAAQGLPIIVPVASLALLLLMPLLAADRYRGLGHVVTDRFLVASSGSLMRERSVLQREGIIGWNVEQTYFQRRVGLATLTATTAAGEEAYAIPDVPLAEAIRVAERAVPGLLQPFLQPSSGRTA